MCAHAAYQSLRKRADFGRVHARGRRVSDARVQIRAWERRGDAGAARLGIVVGKKYGNAVVRNRFKRIVRAAMRELDARVRPGWDVVVLAREAREATSAEMRESLEALLTQLGALEPSA